MDAIARARQGTLGDLLHRSAARHPDKVALVFGERRRTFGELDVDVNRAAHSLADRGLVAGDRLALLSHNSDLFVIVTLAMARLGVICVPINFMLVAEEVAYVLGHSGARGILVEESLVAVATAAVTQAPGAAEIRGVLGSAAPEGWSDVSTWVSHVDSSLPDVVVGPDDVAQIMYTSGTESRPKGAMLSHAGQISQYVSCIVDGEMTGDDIEVHSLPLYHCAQQHCFLMPDLYVGATSIVLPGPDAATILATVERERATKLFCPPTIWIALLRHPDFDSRDLSSLRKGYYGASIMPVAVIEELSARLPQQRLFNFYGQTEMGPLATLLPPHEQLRRLGSAGRASMNVETQIVDDDDLAVPAGTIGEIVHRSPHAMLGYWRAPEQTAEAFRNGWFHSGDLGVLDDDGFLTVVDRKKDMIKTGGENVASREVEEAIYRHPGVAEVAVFGITHPYWIEAVTAVVVPRAGHTVEEAAILAACRGQLAGYKIPKYVVTAEALPKNPSGKILKRELREQWAHLAADPT